MPRDLDAVEAPDANQPELMPQAAARPRKRAKPEPTAAVIGLPDPERDVDRGDLAAVLGVDPDACDPAHRRVVGACVGELNRRGIAIDARGAFRHRTTWERMSGTVGTLARHIAFDLRRGQDVDLGRVEETLHELIDRSARQRRSVLYARLLRQPADPRGVEMAKAWLRAVMLRDPSEADVAAFLHWIWLAKVKQAGRHGDHHLMIVVSGRFQGSGKSTAVHRLCAPWQELYDPAVGVELLNDDRASPALADLAIGLWDELAGIGKADVNRLKSVITAAEIAYRPMGTNTRRSLPQRTTFVATTNATLPELVRDPTGARRFYEIPAPSDQPCDWKAINAIDYDLLWRAVSEDDPPPILAAKALVDEVQLGLVVPEPIDRWLAQETFRELTDAVDASGRVMGSLIHRNPHDGIPTRELLLRCATWCRTAGERPPTDVALGRRLSALGWTRCRKTMGADRVQAYMKVGWQDPGH